MDNTYKLTRAERAARYADENKDTSTASEFGYLTGSLDQLNIDTYKACKIFCDDICNMAIACECFYKYDGKCQIKDSFHYLTCKCNNLQIIRNEMTNEDKLYEFKSKS